MDKVGMAKGGIYPRDFKDTNEANHKHRDDSLDALIAFRDSCSAAIDLLGDVLFKVKVMPLPGIDGIPYAIPDTIIHDKMTKLYYDYYSLFCDLDRSINEICRYRHDKCFDGGIYE